MAPSARHCGWVDVRVVPRVQSAHRHRPLPFALSLARRFRTGARFLQTEAALFRLVGRHGGGILGEFAVKLIIHPDPDGLYLIKGGDRKVWDRFKIRKEWRKSQGIVHGKRCGITENIGKGLHATVGAFGC